jgi:hypothetical protein
MTKNEGAHDLEEMDRVSVSQFDRFGGLIYFILQ